MSSSSEENNSVQLYQRRQREIWLNRFGKEFYTCWLPLLDLCHIISDYLIHYPHQFDAAIMHQSENSDAIVGNDRLSVQFIEVYSGVMTRWPIWKTSPTIHFRIGRMFFGAQVLIGLRRPDSTWVTTHCSGQWLIAKDGRVGGDRDYLPCWTTDWNANLQFETNDLVTIECDFDKEKVYFSKNQSTQKHLVFQNLSNLQSLHFCVEGCLVDFAIEESDAI